MSAPPMLVLALCRCSLDDELQSTKHIGVATARQWSVDAALAVASLHAMRPRALLHRDVKPSNLLLDAADGRVKLADFGLSAWADDADALAHFCGTYAYSAPELLFAPFSAASDVFSLGVTLWELETRLASGVAPTSHIGSGDRAHIVKLAAGYRPPLEHLSAPLAVLLADAWHAVPSRRPSADEIAFRLRAI